MARKRSLWRTIQVPGSDSSILRATGCIGLTAKQMNVFFPSKFRNISAYYPLSTRASVVHHRDPLSLAA